jgi:hydrophobic/amphiphilic exporter-1 (mainly G- bacteria), HAE1 family
VLLFFLRDLAQHPGHLARHPDLGDRHLRADLLRRFTLNLMTLGGLALGVGMMVDSSIVVLENIFRRRREQASPPPSPPCAAPSEVARPSWPAP